MFSTLLFSAVSAKLSIQVEMFASDSGQCNGDRFLRVAVEFDPCAMSDELCTAMESVDCDMIEQGLRDAKNMFPDQPIPTFDECWKVDMALLEEEEQEILDCLPTASPTSLFRRAAAPAAPDMMVVRQFQQFLEDVVLPSAAFAGNRRRQDYSEVDLSALTGLEDFTFGDMKLKCGGTHISSMAASTAGLLSFGIMALVMVVLAVAFCSLYSFKPKSSDQDLEMAPPAANGETAGRTNTTVDV